MFGLTADLASGLGAQWTRVVLRWHNLQSRTGQLQLPGAAEMNRYRGLHILATLRAIPHGSEPRNERKERAKTSEFPQDVRAWDRLVEELSEKYKGQIAVYQIENEVDTAEFWNGTVDEYVALVERTARIIRRVDPQARVALSGLTGAWDESSNQLARGTKIAEIVRKSASHVDIVDIHLYWDYRLIEPRIRYLRTLTDKPIWCTETGGPDIRDYEGADQYRLMRQRMAQGEGMDDAFEVLREINPDSIWLDPVKLAAVQADEVIRRFVVAFGAGVERVFWFINQDMNREANPHFYWMGLTKSGKPKPAFHAYAMMTEQMGDFTELRKIDLGPGVWAYRFKVDGETRYVLWSDRGEREVSFEPFHSSLRAVRLNVASLQQVEVKSEPVQIREGRAVLRLSESPVFVRSTGG